MAAACLAALALALTVLPERWRIASLTAIALLFVGLPQTQLPSPADGRVVAVPLFILLAIVYRRPLTKGYLNLLPLAVSAGWLSLSSLWSSGAPSYILTQFFFAAGLAGLISLTLSRPAEVRIALSIVGVIVIATSLAYLAALPGTAYLGGRLRGPLKNPNTLAAILPLILPAIVATWRRTAIPAWAASALLIWLTGSRAGLLALALQGALWAWGQLRVAGRVSLSLLAVVLGYLWVPNIMQQIASGGAGDSSVLRGNNSRDAVWAYSQELVAQHPIRGSGLASYTSDFETGSSVYAVWIQGGLVAGVLITGTFLLALWRAKSTRDWRIWVIAGGLVNAAFEGWILAAGTVPALILWACVAGTLYSGRSNKNEATRRDAVPSVSPGNPRGRARQVGRRTVGQRGSRSFDRPGHLDPRPRRARALRRDGRHTDRRLEWR